MIGTFCGSKEIKSTIYLTTIICNLIKESITIEIIMNLREKIWWLRIWRDTKNSWKEKAKYKKLIVMISSPQLIIFQETTVYLLRNLKKLGRFGSWSLLVKVKEKVSSYLISYNKLHNGKMSLDGNQRVPRLNLMSFKDILLTLYWLEVRNSIWEYMRLQPVTNHWLFIYIEMALGDLLIPVIHRILMIYQILLCI